MAYTDASASMSREPAIRPVDSAIQPNTNSAKNMNALMSNVITSVRRLPASLVFISQPHLSTTCILT